MIAGKKRLFQRPLDAVQPVVLLGIGLHQNGHAAAQVPAQDIGEKTLVASPLPVEAPVALPLRVVLLVVLVASYALRTSKALALRSAFAARSKAEFCTATLAFLTLNDCSGCLLL